VTRPFWHGTASERAATSRMVNGRPAADGGRGRHPRTTSVGGAIDTWYW
jgi:hypothetical protein